MTSRASFYVTRALIGALEGGFIPGTVLFATYFYKTRELSFRLAFFWSSLNVCAFPVKGIFAVLTMNRSPESSRRSSQQESSKCAGSRISPAGSGFSSLKDC